MQQQALAATATQDMGMGMGMDKAMSRPQQARRCECSERVGGAALPQALCHGQRHGICARGHNRPFCSRPTLKGAGLAWIVFSFLALAVRSSPRAPANQRRWACRPATCGQEPHGLLGGPDAIAETVGVHGTPEHARKHLLPAIQTTSSAAR